MAVKAIHWDQLMPCNTLWPLITLALPLIHDACVVCSLSIEMKPSKTGFPLTVWQVSQRPVPASTSLTSVISSIPLLSLWIITVLSVIMDNDYFGNDSFWDCSAQHGMVFISECLSSTWNTQNLCCHEDDCPLGEQPGDNILYIVITWQMSVCVLWTHCSPHCIQCENLGNRFLYSGKYSTCLRKDITLSDFAKGINLDTDWQAVLHWKPGDVIRLWLPSTENNKEK